jgi:hypothetical protein
VAEPSGIDLMRRRIERASRRPPPAPRARAEAPEPAEATPESAEVAPAPNASVVAEPAPEPAASAAGEARPARRPAAASRPRLAPDLPPVNLAIRVRKPLDDHLADLIHALRRDGVRTSKVELIEMLLWEQTSESARGARTRLAAFRAAAPRGAGAPLSDG